MKKNNSKKVDMKMILDSLLKAGFFSDWRTAPDVIKKLSNKGFTIKGKQIGTIYRVLTQKCQDMESGLEREEIPKEKRIERERWMYKKI
jgi:hypothetical protein